MIPWFYSTDELKKFQNTKSQRKREKVILQQREYVEQQKKILLEKADDIKLNAKDVARRVKYGDKHR